jgi:aryl-alcohol dehydrogenase-like predicted oxidoreductase
VEQRTLGGSDLKISRLGLGTATWGATTDEVEAARQLAAFVRAGGTLVDTADVYGAGRSEEILGHLIGATVARSDIVLATKAVAVFGDPSRRQNASRTHLLATLDKSLTKLCTDHVDLWQLHAWDPLVPLEETLSAVDVAISSGRVRHAGICNYSGWQTAKAANWQRLTGRPPLVSVQVEYSLLQRGVEREVIPAAADSKLGLLAWAPLGRGVLTGKYRHGVPAGKAESRFFKRYVGQYLDERSAAIVTELVAVAERLGLSPLSVALSWVRDRPGVAALLVGARTAEQLEESLATETDPVVLPLQERARLDAVSRPNVAYPESGV